MMDITQEILVTPLAFLPLTSNNNVVQANALRTDWDDLLPAEECSHVVGNPPFFGSSMCSPRQKQEIVDLFGKIKLSNSLDYVSGWYYKASEYIKSTEIRCAFVSTNSITQGEQVAPIWKTLEERFNIHIDFAYRTFKWDNEANDKAQVFVVIIGFSCADTVKPSVIFQSEMPDEPTVQHIANHINAYLIDAPDVFVHSRGKPISDVPTMVYGNKPTDDGNLILSAEERDAIIEANPEATSVIKRYVGAREFLNGGDRWCLWLNQSNQSDWSNSPEILKRVDAVKDFRLASSAAPTREKASRPYEFFFVSHTDNPYLLFPRHSGERREYIPIGFMSPDVIASDATSIVPDATLYDFGVLTSQFHNAWMRTVAGRLKSDYRYSGGVVYNNFVWPNPTSEQRQTIEQAAQAVLDARDAHPGKSLAGLYDPDKMPADLLAAHKALDKAVEQAYGVNFNGDEEKIVAHLFKLYADKTSIEDD